MATLIRSAGQICTWGSTMWRIDTKITAPCTSSSLIWSVTDPEWIGLRLRKSTWNAPMLHWFQLLLRVTWRPRKDAGKHAEHSVYWRNTRNKVLVGLHIWILKDTEFLRISGCLFLCRSTAEKVNKVAESDMGMTDHAGCVRQATLCVKSWMSFRALSFDCIKIQWEAHILCFSLYFNPQ